MFIMTYNVHRASCILHCINWYEMFSKILQCHFRLTLSLISNIWILYLTENCVMFTEITFHLCMKSFICHIIEEFCIRTIRQFCCRIFFISQYFVCRPHPHPYGHIQPRIRVKYAAVATTTITTKNQSEKKVCCNNKQFIPKWNLYACLWNMKAALMKHFPRRFAHRARTPRVYVQHIHTFPYYY